VGSSRAPGRRVARPAPEPPADRDTGAAADPVEVARTIVLTQLTAGPRTRAQLAAALARRQVPPEVGDAVLDRFTEVGLVDDAAFADAWVASRHAGRGLARRALRHELARRGVDDAVAATALEQVDDDAERASALALARRRMAATTGLDPQVRLRRTIGALARRGYGGGLAADVARQALQEHPSSGVGAGPGPDSTGSGEWFVEL